jgi:dipeptidyl aminopeptidase/acylaminoacyl peptidase
LKTDLGLFIAISICALSPVPIEAKPSLDVTYQFVWPSVAAGQLSDNGRFAMYEVRIDHPADMANAVSYIPGTTLNLTAIDGGWKKTVENVAQEQFTANSTYAVVLDSDHNLMLIELGTDKVEEIGNVGSFRVAGESKNNWLAYRTNDNSQSLFVRNLTRSDSRTICHVNNYSFGNSGENLIYETNTTVTQADTVSLHWLRLSDGVETTIWRGNAIEKFVFDGRDTQLAFIGASSASMDSRSLWHYWAGSQSAELWVEQSPDAKESLSSEGIQFSDDGRALFWSVHPPRPALSQVGSVSLDLWSYRDRELQSAQLRAIASGAMPERRRAVLVRNPRTAIEIDGEGEGPSYGRWSNYILVRRNGGLTPGECAWLKSAAVSTDLLSLHDGTKVHPGSDESGCEMDLTQSPDGKYLLKKSPTLGFLSFNTQTQRWTNISAGARLWTAEDDGTNLSRTASGDIEGWFEGEQAVLVWDHHDYWRLDLTGRQAPISITGSLGIRKHMVFKLLRPAGSPRNLVPRPEPGGWLLFAAFDEQNKSNGFYKLKVGNKNPTELTMGRYGDFGVAFGEPPIRAKNASVYLVKREGVSESPNYFWTQDFISFYRLSDVRPESEFNWLTSELIQWKNVDGRYSRGVMYKPENFDPTKSYPLIVEIYESKTADLNTYLSPIPFGTQLDIPHLVSGGYLVVLPDIRYTPEGPGISAYNSVISAVNYLITLPWVDGQRMGIQGGSFGGFEVNYIIGHSDQFRAAYSRAGPSDLVSYYGSIGDYDDGRGFMDWAENSQGRLGAPWQNLDKYLRNSPILAANNVNTPLLMVHNREDDRVPFSQGVEFFSALRRLNKRVWMLQYDHQAHHVDGPDGVDLSIRARQFFDYYLKEEPPPIWMMEGIPARLKGIESGLQLDRSGRVP